MPTAPVLEPRPAGAGGWQTVAPRTLVDDLLQEQRLLPAAARFAQWHETGPHPVASGSYRDLIPLTQPTPGRQYAFEVDLDKCSGCKACVSGCHSLNGLDDGETWRDIGLLVSDDWRQPFQQTVTTACHHCVDPACLNGCPVLAYDKDPVTGIVRHLDDQCIGCQYCVLKCPYDVPKYSAKRGIVRKCDLCSHRLAAGEAPACVQACPNEAIRITLVETTTVEHECRANTNRFLPGAPAPDYTLPSTRYKTARQLPPSLRAADREELRPEPAHTPLVVMLVLSQLAAGLFAFNLLLGIWPGADPLGRAARLQTLTGFCSAAAALLAGLLHLGRPLGVWRAFLGWRKSWLSREMLVFGSFLLLSGCYAASVRFPEEFSSTVRSVFGWICVGSGLAGVFCSAMIYHDTRRDYWRLPATGGKFLGTTWLLGAAGTLVLVSVDPGPGPSPILPALAGLIVLATAFKLGVEPRVLRHLARDDFSPLHKTALLLTGYFGLTHRVGIACRILGGAVLPALLAVRSLAPGQFAGPLTGLPLAAASVFGFCLAGEVIERRLFFAAVQPVKMPGAISS
ncbi:MAG: DmsC/YnfH family molybdoenzyme membrane anchor subunit [Limisphaerales bacterium]